MVTRFHIGLRWLLLIVCVMVITAVPTAASTMRLPSSTGEPAWATYVDPRFDFSVEYPAHWQVTPRDDRPGYVGGMLVFEEPDSGATADSAGSQRTKIDLGFYLVEREPSQPLADWTDAYRRAHSVFAPEEVHVIRAHVAKLAGGEAFREDGTSPLADYSYVNIAHGRVVWFISGYGVGATLVDIVGHVANSLKFGPRAPKTLQDAYGADFRPLPLDARISSDTSASGAASVLGMSSYRVPVRVSAPIKCGNLNAPICPNGSHHGSLAWAIDISVVTGTSVKNSATSYTNSTGEDPTGAGLYVTMYDSGNGYVAHYYHLSSINYSTLYNNWPVPQGMEIALSGESGAACHGAHLHFHVRTSPGASPVYLGGMAGLTLRSNYPNCTWTDPSHCDDFDCTCGYVN